MDTVLIGSLFFLGLCVGSFLNVAVLRFGFNERSSPRSRCAACDATLGPNDLVPVLSYVALRGRCRQCGSAVSLQYPLVELATGCLFALTAAVLPEGVTLPATFLILGMLGFWAALVALVTYDLRHTLIPLQFVYALWAFGAVVAVVRAIAGGTPSILIDACVAALVCGGFFAAIHFLTKGKGMGIGDAYVAFGIGLALGLERGIVACVLGVWIGALVGVLMLVVEQLFPHAHIQVAGRHVTLKTEIPFAPFLAVGTVIAFCIPIASVWVGVTSFSLL